MTHITSRKRAPRVSLLATATLAAGFAPLVAQAADSADAGSRNATELDKVQGLRLLRSPLDKLLGTSSLQLDTAGAHGDVALTLHHLPQAQAQQVMEQLAAALARRKLRW